MSVYLFRLQCSPHPHSYSQLCKPRCMVCKLHSMGLRGKFGELACQVAPCQAQIPDVWESIGMSEHRYLIYLGVGEAQVIKEWHGSSLHPGARDAASDEIPTQVPATSVTRRYWAGLITATATTHAPSHSQLCKLVK